MAKCKFIRNLCFTYVCISNIKLVVSTRAGGFFIDFSMRFQKKTGFFFLGEKINFVIRWPRKSFYHHVANCAEGIRVKELNGCHGKEVEAGD